MWYAADGSIPPTVVRAPPAIMVAFLPAKPDRAARQKHVLVPCSMYTFSHKCNIHQWNPVCRYCIQYISLGIAAFTQNNRRPVFMALNYYKYYRNITLTMCNLPPANRAPNRLPRRRTETTTP